MNERSVFMRDLTGPEMAARQSTSTVLLPVGAIEQHGPHLPLDTDALIASAFAAAAARRVGGVVAPTLEYGYRSNPSSGGGETFPGTTSISGQTLTFQVRDIVQALGRHGHHDIAIVNGHYENAGFIGEGGHLALQDTPGTLTLLLVNWWELVRPDVLDSVFGDTFPGWEADHAGVVETSLMLHLDPERVRTEKIEDRVSSIVPHNYTVLPERTGLVDPSGVIRTARGASADKGRTLFDTVTEELTAAINDEFAPPTSAGSTSSSTP